MSVNIASVTDEEKKNAFVLYEQLLKMEQMWFKQFQDAARSWESKVHEDFFNYNSARRTAIDHLVTDHIKTHFPILQVKNAEAVKPAVGVCLGTYADRLGFSKEDVYKVMMVNCSYLGTNAHIFTKDMAKVVGDLIASNPALCCAVVIFSNAWSLVSQEACAHRTQLWFRLRSVSTDSCLAWNLGW